LSWQRSSAAAWRTGNSRHSASAQTGQGLRRQVGAAAEHDAQRLLQHLRRLALGQESHRPGIETKLRLECHLGIGVGGRANFDADIGSSQKG